MSNQDNQTPREELEKVIGDAIPDVFGTSARRVLDAIKEAGGVVLMPTDDIMASPQYHQMGDDCVDFDQCYVNVLDEQS